MWEGAGDRTETAIFWPPLLWPSTLCLSLLQGCSTGSPEAHSAGWSAISYQQLLCTLTNQGPKAPSAWCGFPYHISSITPSDLWFLSWLSYIIVQRPLSRLLDLWNRMFDRHQAEITVMQFTGNSLPVYQSMSVPWDLFSPRPISSANFRPRDFLS